MTVYRLFGTLSSGFTPLLSWELLLFVDCEPFSGPFNVQQMFSTLTNWILASCVIRRIHTSSYYFFNTIYQTLFCWEAALFRLHLHLVSQLRSQARLDAWVKFTEFAATLKFDSSLTLYSLLTVGHIKVISLTDWFHFRLVLDQWDQRSKQLVDWR